MSAQAKLVAAETSVANTLDVAHPAANESTDNLIKRTVDEVCALMARSHDAREDLMAHGVKFHMLNALIELGVNDNHEQLTIMSQTALEASIKAHGPQAIKRDELDSMLNEIITHEKELRHVRQIAQKQGINMQAFNQLTQLMRLNRGDNGAKAVNSLLGYALAAGIELDRIDEVREQFSGNPKSVMPEIEREPPATRRERLEGIVKHLVCGLALTFIVMWFVL